MRQIKILDIECTEQSFEAPGPLKQPKPETQENEEKPTEDCNPRGTAGTSKETHPKEISKDLIEYSLAPEVSEKETRDEISKEAESTSRAVAEGTSLQETRENKMQPESPDEAFAEKDVETTQLHESMSDDAYIINEAAESSELGENKSKENPTLVTYGADEAGGNTASEVHKETQDTLSKNGSQREVSTIDTCLNDIVEQNLKEVSALSAKEHNPITYEASETKEDTSEKVIYTTHSPLAVEAAEEKLLLKEEFVNPRDDPNMGPIDVENESENNKVCDQNQDLLMTPASNTEGISESQAVLSGHINFSEVDKCSETHKLENLEDEKSLNTGVQKVSEDENPVNKASACDEDTGKAILGQENSARNYESSTTEGVDNEKATAELDAGGHSQGIVDAETQSTTTITDENLEPVEPFEKHRFASIPVAEDHSKETIPETNNLMIEEDSNTVKDQNFGSIEEKPIGQAFEEDQSGKDTVKDVIFVEEVAAGEVHADESKSIKEQLNEEESCTTELQIPSTEDQIVNEVTDPNQVPSEHLEAKDSNDNTVTVESETFEYLTSKSEVHEEETKKGIEKSVNATNSVTEESVEKIKEENTEAADNCESKIDTSRATLTTDETSLEEVPVDDKCVRASFDSTTDDKSLAMTTVNANPHGEIGSVKLEETSGLVSQIPKNEYEIAEKESVMEENLAEVEVEETKTSDATSESIEKDVEEIHETRKSPTMENIKEQLIEKESCTLELQRTSGANNTINEVKNSDQVPAENLEATCPSDNIETKKVMTGQDFNCESEASSTTNARGQENIKEESPDTADNCDDGINTAPITLAREETSLEEVQLDDKLVRALDTTSDDMSLPQRTTDANPHGEVAESVKLEETAALVSQLPATECEIEDKKIVIEETPDAVEFEATITSDAVSEPKEKDVKELHEMGRSLTVEDIKKKLTKEESCATELQKILAADETLTEIKDTDDMPIENLEEIYPNDNIETEKAGDLNCESQALSTEKAQEEETKQTVEKPVDVTSSVAEEFKEKIKEEITKAADNCDDRTNTAPITLEREETSLEEVQLDDKLVRALDTTSDDMSLPQRTTDANPHGEVAESVKLEETAALVSQLPATECEIEDKKIVIEETPDAVEFEATITSDAVSEPKEKDVKELHEIGRSLTVEDIKEKLTKEESCATELQKILAADETLTEIKDTDDMPIENLEEIYPNDNIETEKAGDLNCESQALSTEKAQEEETKQTVEKPVDVTSSVAEEFKEKIKEEITKAADNCDDRTNTAPITLEREETSLEEVQLDDKLVRALDTTSDDMSLPQRTTDANPHDEVAESVKLEETAALVSQLTATECEIEDKKIVIEETPDAVEFEATITSDAVSEPKEKDVKELHEIGRSLTVEDIKEKLTKEESCATELQKILTADETLTEVKDTDDMPIENLEAIYPNDNIETEKAGDLNCESQALSTEKAQEEETKQTVEKPVDVTSSVAEEFKEKIKEEITKAADNCDDRTNTAPITLEREETSLEEVQLDDKLVRSHGTTSDDMSLPQRTTDAKPHDEVAESVKLEETAAQVSQLPATECEIAKTPDAVEFEAAISSDAVSEPKEKDVEELHEIRKSLTMEDIKEKLTKEESCTTELQKILTADETLTEVKDTDEMPIENLEAIYSNDNIETDTADDLTCESQAFSTEKAQDEETNQSVEKPVGVTSSVAEEFKEKIKEENTKAAENCDDEIDTAPVTLVREETSLEQVQLVDKPFRALDTTSEDMSLSMRTIDTNPNGEEVSTVEVEETSVLVSQIPINQSEIAYKEGVIAENRDAVEIEETKTSDAVSGSIEKDVKDTHESEKGLAMENIKEQLIEQESHTKEVQRISTAEDTVNEVKASHQGPIENLETTYSIDNTETEKSLASDNLNCESEASSNTKAPKGDIIQGTEKAVNATSSIAEESEEEIKEENIEARETLVIEETSLEEVKLDDKCVRTAFETATDDKSLAMRTIDGNLDGEEVDNVKLEETSGLSQIPTNECHIADKKSMKAEDSDAVEVEEPKTSTAVSESKREDVTEIHDTGKSLAMENIKEQFIKDESCTTELQRISTTNETTNEVKDSDQPPTETLEAACPSDNKEAETSSSAKDPNWEPEAYSITESLAGEIKQGVENPVDVTKSVAEELEEKMNEQNAETADDSDDKINITVAREETSLVAALDTVTDDKSLAMRTIDDNPHGEEVDSVKLDETSGPSRIPTNECQIADEKCMIAEDSNAVEGEEPKSSATVYESKKKDAREIHDTGKSLVIENIKEQFIEDENCTTELQRLSKKNETVNEVKDSDQPPTETLEAACPSDNKEAETSSSAKDPNWEPEAYSITESLAGEIKQGVENPVDVTKSVAEELEEKMNEQNAETADDSDDKINITVAREETSLVAALDTVTDDKSLAMRTIDDNPHGEEVDSVKLEETSGPSRIPTNECQIADEKSMIAEDSNAVEGEEPKSTATVSESKKKDAREIHDTGKSLVIENIKEQFIEDENCTTELQRLTTKMKPLMR
ncbi:unnamed protein product [Ilex paraguariensis]|uniref:Titin-like n=1 Tax=Ilex paraguariensis TaxID=185542 RepID=A0ABC8U4Z1_9AQUA